MIGMDMVPGLPGLLSFVTTASEQGTMHESVQMLLYATTVEFQGTLHRSVQKSNYAGIARSLVILQLIAAMSLSVTCVVKQVTWQRNVLLMS
jgi:mannose/fructose/N-acetylgalactosamine-specific phosphotransferase system component IIC